MLASPLSKAPSPALKLRWRYVPSAQRNFENTARAADIITADLLTSGGLLAVISQVSTESVRNEAAQQMVQVEQFVIEKISTSRHLFQAFKDVNANDRPKDAQFAYWLDEGLDNFRRKGLDLSDDVFEKVKGLEKELSALASEFQQNIAADSTHLEFPEADLKGTPATVVGTLGKTDKGDLIVKMDYPPFSVFLITARSLQLARRSLRHSVTGHIQ
eukprot:gene381-biopygen347